MAKTGAAQDAAGERRTGDTISIVGDYQHKAYHSPSPIQRFWHQSKARLIRAILPASPGEQVLDVGCGSGVMTGFLGELGANVVGIDGNPEALAFASSQYAGPNVSFMQGLVDVDFSLPYAVDKIYCLEVIEHIYYKQGKSMLQAFYKILKPGGFVYLTTPNYAGTWLVIEKIFDLFQVTPKMAGEQHVEFYTPRKLKSLSQETGFEIHEVHIVNLLAPWLAPLSWKLALRIEQLEMKWNLAPGAILVFVLRKPEEPAG